MLTKIFQKKKIELLVLLVIMLAAAFLRLYRIADYMTFLGDEGRDVLVVKRILVDRRWTLLGPTASVGGFFLGPIYYYLMLPFLWLFRLNPVGPAVMVSLFGIATVFLVYRAGKDFFNYKVGLLAAGLYAISPLVIAYSRSSWNPNLMPFFCLLVIWLVQKTTTLGNLKLLGLIGFLFGIAFQLHYLATFLLVVVGVYFLIFGVQRKNFRAYLCGIGGFLVGWSPFLLFELRHSFPNFRSLYQFIFFGKETGFAFNKFWPIINDISFRLFNRLVTNNVTTLAYLLLLVVLPLFVFYWRQAKKEKINLFQTFSLLGFWLILGIILFVFYQDDIYDYYFGFMFPLPFLLTGFALEKISQKKLGFWLAGGVVLWLAIVNLKGIPFRYPPNRQLAQTEKIARFVFDQAEDKPFNFGLITGGNSDHAYRYFLEIWGNPPVTIENPQVDPERKTVTDQLFVVCESLPCYPLGYSLWEIASFGRAEIVDQWDVSVHKVYQLKHWQKEDE